MLVAVLAAAAIAAADVPKTLRTLVYRVAYDVSARLEMRGSGMGNGVDPGPASGSGNETREFATANRGTLRVDVLAATGDAGLIVDCRLDGDRLSQPAARVAIFPDGRLAYDRAVTLAPEARLLLPLLARDLLADRDLRDGAAWSVDWAAPGRGTTRYAVEHVEGERARLRITRTGTLPGGVTESGVTETTYETRLLDPLALEYHGTVRTEPTFQERRTERIALTASLLSDTFANR